MLCRPDRPDAGRSVVYRGTLAQFFKPVPKWRAFFENRFQYGGHFSGQLLKIEIFDSKNFRGGSNREPSD